MKKHLVVLLALICAFGSSAVAQSGSYRNKTKKKQFYGNQRLHQPLYKWVTGPHQRHGIQLSFGPTYTFTRMNAVKGEMRINGDSLFRYSHEAKSRIGIFVELGMVHITKRPRKLIQYYDWGIGYKHIGGREFFESGLYASSYSA